MEIAIVLMFSVIVVGLGYLIAELRRINVKEYHESLSDVITPLSAYEAERLEREEEFDLRILHIKEELAKQQTAIRHATQNAEELHPLVKNLPHNSIRDTQREPIIEYAE